MEGSLFGLTNSKLHKLVYELTGSNKQHKVTVEKEQAGKDWLREFLRRHPDLSWQRPENTSAARAADFNKIFMGWFKKFSSPSFQKESSIASSSWT